MNFLKSKRRRAAGAARPQQIIVDSLGKLEFEVMQAVWQAKEVSVRDVYLELKERLAYTTVMTTLDRLHKKGLLDRRKQGRAFFYAASYSSIELERRIASGMIDDLLAQEPDKNHVLSYFVETVSERDQSLLDELERLVQEKRRELENKQ